MRALTSFLTRRAARSVSIYFVFMTLYGARATAVGEDDAIVTLAGVVCAGVLAWLAGRETLAPVLQYLAQLPVDRRGALMAPWITSARVLVGATVIVVIIESTGLARWALHWTLEAFLGPRSHLGSYERPLVDCLIFIGAPIVWFMTASAFLLRRRALGLAGALVFAAGIAAWILDRDAALAVYVTGAAVLAAAGMRPLMVAAASRDLDVSCR